MSDRPPPPRGGLPEDASTLIAEYALGLIPAAERRGVAAALARSPALRTELAWWEEALAPMADEVVPVTPRRRTWRRLERRLFGRPRRERNVAPWAVATLASAALAVVLVAPDRRTPPAPSEPVLLAEIAAQGDALRVLAAYDPASGEVRVRRTAGDAAPGRALQLWAIGASGTPVSIGVLPDAAGAALPLPPSLRGEVGSLTLAISDEPPGGSPDPGPSGDVLATGPLLAI